MDSLEDKLLEAYEESPAVRSLAKEKKLLVLDETIKNGDSSRIFENGLQKIMAEHHTKEIYEKEPEIDILNYKSFIKQAINMSIEDFLIQTKDMTVDQVVEFAQKRLEESQFNPEDAVYLFNQNTQMNGYKSFRSENSSDAVLNEVLASYLFKKGLDSTLLLANSESKLTKLEVPTIEPTPSLMRSRNYDLFKIGFYNSLNVLNDKASSIKHKIGNYKDSKFIEKLSNDFNNLNLQSTFPKKFAFISDRVKSKGKFDVISLKEDLDNIDFTKYSAIFIDNSYDTAMNYENTKIGKGIEFLKKLGLKEDEKKEDMPIVFYQTAHDMWELKHDEKRLIQRLGAYILPKNVAPKLNKSKLVADKEANLPMLLRKDWLEEDASILHKELRKYLIEPAPVSFDGPKKVVIDNEEYFLSFTNAAKIPKDNKIRDSEFESFGIENNDLNRKMYTLSLLHNAGRSILNELPDKNLVEDKDIFYDESVSAYVDSYKIASKINYLDNKVIGLYKNLIDEHKELIPTTISHNDTKWDNWFGDVLGDFGHANIGTEYKDIARAFLNEETLSSDVVNYETLDNTIDAYLKISRLDLIRDEKEFKQKVYEALFIESLRLASYESDKSKELTDSLVNIANQMYEALSDGQTKQEPIKNELELAY